MWIFLLIDCRKCNHILPDLQVVEFLVMRLGHETGLVSSSFENPLDRLAIEREVQNDDLAAKVPWKLP
jgi:hypothetical protein